MDQEIIFWVLWGDHYDRVWSNPIKARRVVWYIEYCILNITYDSYYSVITDKDTGKCKYDCIMHLWSDRKKTGNVYVYLWQGLWCPSYLSLLHGHVLVISNMIRYNVQMWYPICLIYNLVACWAFSEIQGHLPHFQDQYMKFWFLRFHHFHRTFGDNFLMPFKMEWWTIIYVHVFVAWLDLQYFQNNNYILKT